MPPFLLLAACAALLFVASSCQKNETELYPPEAACAPAAKTVKTVTDAAGIVRFNTTLRQYEIAVHQPGTIDVVEVGVVCAALPPGLQADGTKVVVSGTFKEYGQSALSSSPAGTTYYYLAVFSVRLP